MIDISKYDKADVLAALYNASKAQGLGYFAFDAKPMTHEQADELLEKQKRFDYLKGRIMKVDLSGNELNPWSYDRDNGQGAAYRAIADIKQEATEAKP